MVAMKALNLLIISLLFILNITASETINFSSLGVDKGLSHSTVVDIVQDKHGLMWFATYNGLNRYDGYDFRAYHHDEMDSLSIGSDIIRCLEYDLVNGLWIGTNVGLSLYDPEKDVFSNYSCSLGGFEYEVKDLVCQDNNKLLLVTEFGLMEFDISSHQFSKDGLPDKLMNIRPKTICKYDDDIYVGADEGIFVYSLKNRNVKTLLSDNFRYKMILSMLKVNDRTLWVGTEGDGLYRINLNTEDCIKYHSGDKGFSSNYVRSLAVDTFGKLWVGTITSLNVYDDKKDIFTIYDNNLLKENSLSQTSVRSLYRDIHGGMWVGTFWGGVNYYHPLQQRFHNIRNIPYHNSLSDNVVSCIVEDTEGSLWIGTNNGGLNKYSLLSGKFTCYTKKNGLNSNDIKSVYVDNRIGKVYIGGHTSNGLNVLDKKTGLVKKYEFGGQFITGGGIYQIIFDEDRKLLLGCASGSILSFNMDNGHVKRLLFDDGKLLEKKIYTMYKDSLKRIWVGTSNGLRVYTRKLDSLYTYSVPLIEKELETIGVNVIHRSKSGIFWIGTSNGLYGYTDDYDELIHYTVHQGLPNNVVVGLLEDERGNIWISTECGMSCFSPTKKTFRNFTVTDGIQSNQFTAYAYCKTVAGNMYFGGVNGITEFNPSSLPDNPYIPSVIITDLFVFNRKVKPGDNTKILDKHICETNEITLSSSQSMFSLSFSVTDYISGKHNTFSHRLDGYEDEWILTDGDNRNVSYSNLPPGEYRFMIKAANKDGLWNDVPTILKIKVLPAWYETWLARVVFVLLALIAVIMIFRFFWFRQSVRMQLEMERVDKERMREIHEGKLRFFINLSHELRTPLTLILAPLHDVMHSISDKKILSRLKYVNSNANRLLYLVNQLMDYRRAELGIFKLNVKKQELFKTVSRVYLYYNSLAEDAGIDYVLDAEQDGKELYYDASYMELILNNLLSNAFKYTDKGGNITLSAKEKTGILYLRVTDTGKGIPLEKQNLIFERFYQIDKEHIGSGIGLSLVKKLVEMHHGTISLESSLGKGSSFIIEIPVRAEDYKFDELCDNMDCTDMVYATNSENMYLFDANKVIEKEDSDDVSEEGIDISEENPTVLVVEDNVEVCDYLVESLSGYFNVLKAENGEDALDIIEENTVNLVLTDVMMPVMDGIQLCKRIKRNIQTSHIPVIMLSAKSDVKDQFDGLNIGADDYISKPFYMDILLTKIKNILRTYMSAVEHYKKSDEVIPEKVALNVVDKEFLEKAIEIVKSHLDDIEFSADVFASEMNMSRSTLHLKMKAITGSSTIDFIRKIRFSEACRLLSEGRFTITEISELVGFNSSSYFATCFKKYIGCQPSEYIKKN